MIKPAVLVLERKSRYGREAILHCSVHKDAATAYGTAMLEMDQYMHDSNDEYYFSSIYRLDADAGFGFDAVYKKDEDDMITALILDIANEGENQNEA